MYVFLLAPACDNVCFLGGNATVDAFPKRATRRIDCELFLVRSEELLVRICQALNPINVLDILVRSIASNLARSMGKHSTKLLVIALKQKARTPVRNTLNHLVQGCKSNASTYHESTVQIDLAICCHLS